MANNKSTANNKSSCDNRSSGLLSDLFDASLHRGTKRADSKENHQRRRAESTTSKNKERSRSRTTSRSSSRGSKKRRSSSRSSPHSGSAERSTRRRSAEKERATRRRSNDKKTDRDVRSDKKTDNKKAEDRGEPTKSNEEGITAIEVVEVKESYDPEHNWIARKDRQEEKKIALADGVIAVMKKAMATNPAAFSQRDIEEVRSALFMWTEATNPQKAKVYNQSKTTFNMDDEAKSKINPDFIFYTTTNLYSQKANWMKTASEFLGVDRQGRCAHEISLYKPTTSVKTERRTMRNLINNSMLAASDSLDNNILNPFHRYTDSYVPYNIHFLEQIHDESYAAFEKLNDREFASIGTIISLATIIAVRQTLVAMKADVPPPAQAIAAPSNTPLWIPARYRANKTAISASEYIKLLELSERAKLPLPKGLVVLEEENFQRRQRRN